MKIKITTQEPDEVQSLFLRPLDFQQRVEIKKLQIVESLLRSMESLGMNRSKFAQKMGVSSPRITSMLDGTNNFTVETLMRAAESVDGELEVFIAPKDHKVRWIIHQDDDCHPVFRPKRQEKKVNKNPFVYDEDLIAETDPCYAA